MCKCAIQAVAVITSEAMANLKHVDRSAVSCKKAAAIII